jgi:hypothetical protein
LEAEEIFTRDDISVIAQAFDRVLKEKGLIDRKDAVLMIAKLTIQIALKGERDPGRIAEAVLDQLSE